MKLQTRRSIPRDAPVHRQEHGDGCSDGGGTGGLSRSIVGVTYFTEQSEHQMKIILRFVRYQIYNLTIHKSDSVSHSDALTLLILTSLLYND